LTQLRLTRRPTEDIVALAQPSFADDFHAMMDKWHAVPEIYDNELDAQYHEMQARKLRDKPLWPRRPYFSPSSATACKRELYVKTLGAKKDGDARPPHQGRWTRMGTAWGDVIQRDLLFIEKHWPRIFGEPAPFVPLRNEAGEPMWEDFAKRNVPVRHRGHTFYLYGKPDGLLRHTPTDAIVGIELKSKQTTPSRTSEYSMRSADDKHASQVAGYAIMYEQDVWCVPYGNLAKQKWEMTDEEYAKYPDLRVFQLEITQDDKLRFCDYLADVLDAVAAKTPPPLDITKWTFNSFKNACAASLTDEEMDEIRAQVERVKAAKTMKPYEKDNYVQALADIEARREKASEGQRTASAAAAVIANIVKEESA
jgi:hypothetical protein